MAAFSNANLFLRAIMKTAITTVILAISISASAQSQSEAVDKIFAHFARPDSPGCALAISQNGQVSYQHAYGMADLERNVPAAADSVFDVGSIAKQFTAASIMLLVQQGKLKLSDSPRKYVPELPGYYDQVTIDHLVHHSSGMPEIAALVILMHEGLGTQHISDLEAEA